MPQISIDFAARKVVIASMLYYGLDEEFMPDPDFDQLCKRLANEWEGLTSLRQWQLGSPEEIAASGFHVKVTWAAESAAVSWLHDRGRLRCRILFNARERNFSKKHRVHWLKPGDYRFEDTL